MICCYSCKRLVAKEHSFVSSIVSDYANTIDELFEYNSNSCIQCRESWLVPFLEAKASVDLKIARAQQLQEAERVRIEMLYKEYPLTADLILSFERLREENKEIRRLCQEFVRNVDAIPYL